MKAENRSDPGIGRAAEEAEGVEVFEQIPTVGLDLHEHDEAQGIDVFDSPDAVVPTIVLRERARAGEGFSGEEAEIDYAGDADYDRVPVKRYPEF